MHLNACCVVNHFIRETACFTASQAAASFNNASPIDDNLVFSNDETICSWRQHHLPPPMHCLGALQHARNLRGVVLEALTVRNALSLARSSSGHRPRRQDLEDHQQHQRLLLHGSKMCAWLVWGGEGVDIAHPDVDKHDTTERRETSQGWWTDSMIGNRSSMSAAI